MLGKIGLVTISGLFGSLYYFRNNPIPLSSPYLGAFLSFINKHVLSDQYSEAIVFHNSL